jgi:outer membrane protein assembly factor BamB
MATLEVRDSRGRIQRVEVSREHPVLFGSNPRCDIVLDGPGVHPFHGRVRWKSDRYKVDASPEAEFLVLNGHKMASASFRHGDQIAVGPCRITMLDFDAAGPAQGDDKTRVQAAPLYAKPEPLKRGWRRNRAEARSADQAIDDEFQPSAPKPRGWKALTAIDWRAVWRVLIAGDRPPGQENILTSPLVIGLVCALLLLAVLGVGLRAVIVRTTNEKLYGRAMESMDEGDYRNAIRRFDEFLAVVNNPKDSRVSKSKVNRALANVRQFTSSTGASWTHALEAERAMLSSVSEEPAFRDSAVDLGDEVLKTGEALADRARAGADAEALAEAEAAVALLNQVVGEAADTMLKKSGLPRKVADARAAVRKAEIRKRALAAMDEALKAGSSARVYSARDRLVRQYAELSEDRDVLSRMKNANELIRRAVKVDGSRRPGETEPHPEPFGPPTSLVLRGFTIEKPADAAESGAIVYAIAEGFLYGLDGGSGRPLWQRSVGLASPIPPQPVPGGTSVLVVDSRHNELVRLDGQTGSLLWRQRLEGPVSDPPLLLGNQLIQPTQDGKLQFLDLKSGEHLASVRLGLKRSVARSGSETVDVGVRTPVSDEVGQYLYAVADQDCLFILKRDPIECVGVDYLGHAAGSIPCAPARSARFLIVPENYTLAETRWRTFIIDEDGAKIRPSQQLTFPGWTWETPPTIGSIVWAVGDRGSITAISIGTYDQKEPFRLVARINPDARESGPAYAVARSERELWVGSGRPSRIDLDLEGGKLASGWALADTGPALAPVQVAGTRMVLTQQYTDGQGVSVVGLNPQSGSVLWRTVLGTPWPLALTEAPDGEGLTTLVNDGRVVSITKAQLGEGGFVEVQIPRPGAFRLPSGPLQRLEAEGVSVIVPGSEATYLLARAGSAEFRRIDLPTPVGAEPILFGKDVLVPGSDGRVYLIDPLTGESRAEPYIPSFDRAHPTRWRKPARIDAETVALADEAGHVRRLIRVTKPRPRLVAATEVNLGKEIVSDPASTGGAVVVATADGRLRALSGRDLSPAGAWPLDAALAVAPVAVSGRCFLADKTRGVLALGAEGQRLWSTKLRDAVAIGPPVVKDQAIWFLASDGSIQRLALTDGKVLDRIPLDVFPAGGIRTAGAELAVPVGLGTVRLLDPKSLGGGKTTGGQ